MDSPLALPYGNQSAVFLVEKARDCLAGEACLVERKNDKTSISCELLRLHNVFKIGFKGGLNDGFKDGSKNDSKATCIEGAEVERLQMSMHCGITAEVPPHTFCLSSYHSRIVILVRVPNSSDFKRACCKQRATRRRGGLRGLPP